MSTKMRAISFNLSKNIKKPNTSIKTPNTILIFFECFVKKVSFCSINVINKKVIKNGMASPSEYAKSKKNPSVVLFDIADVEAMMLPKIGPKQGVHPSEKAIPIPKPDIPRNRL